MEEKNGFYNGTGDVEAHSDSYEVVDAPAAYTSDYTAGNSMYAKIQRAAGKFGVEQRGIERVPEDERTDVNIYKIGTLVSSPSNGHLLSALILKADADNDCLPQWCSANMVVSSFAIGALSVPVFSLGFVDSFLTILFLNILAILPVAFYSTFGSHFGLRQMVLSRFFFGGYAVKIIAFLNVLACIGWSAVNVIVGAQLINTVNPNVPGKK